MNVELTRPAVASVIAFFVIAFGLLGFMLERLGTLPGIGPGTHRVQVVFPNAEGLPIQADVLVHGVKVGSVTGVQTGSDSTLVTLALTSSAPVLHSDASAAVGSKTPLGEAFVDLQPGAAPGRLHGRLPARSSVEIDDALAWLNRPGRTNLRAALTSLGAGVSDPAAGGEMNASIAELRTTTAAVGRLAAELGAQRGALTEIISGGRHVLDEIAARPGLVRSLLLDARTTLGAIAVQRESLGQVLDRIPGLLTSADATLRSSRPLIHDAAPVVSQIAAAAPDMTRALEAVPEAAAAARSLLASAPALTRSVIPALDAARRLSPDALRALAVLGPALADLVPVTQYLGPRGKTIAAWFANTADLGSHGDAKGDWARFFVMFDPATLLGLSSNAPKGNSYTAPGDAADNQPYRPGGYPRLAPYAPALGR